MNNENTNTLAWSSSSSRISSEISEEMRLVRLIRNSSAEPQLRLATSKGEVVFTLRRVGQFALVSPTDVKTEEEMGKFSSPQDREKLETVMIRLKKGVREMGFKGAKWALIPGATY